MMYVGRVIRFAVLVIASVVLASCGYEAQSGFEAASSRSAMVTTGYSPVVMIILPNGTGLCSGTFVSEKAVLTAAHCVLESGRYQVNTDWGRFSTTTRVFLGRGDVNSPDDIALLIFDRVVASREEGRVYDIADDVQVRETLRLVGFGCDNVVDYRGAGVKRTGTNQVAGIDEYVEFVTPLEATLTAVRGIVGPENRAASCFGDSGGPALRSEGGKLKVAAVTHAGGKSSTTIYSQYANVASQSSNRSWLREMNNAYDLGIEGI